MSNVDPDIYSLSYSQVWSGFKSLLPISSFVVIFGAAFGLAATQTGLDNSSIMLMSSFVFAGASQFATLELWGAQISLIPLIVTVFFINARHLLMGASLYPWLRHLPPIKRYSILLVISDANWALSLQAFNRGESGMGLLFGGGIALWLAWVLGTGLGFYFGNVIHHPALLGLDMVMACFLLAMVVGGQKNLRILIIWTIAACSSLLAYWYLPENSHVVVGALFGGIVGIFWKEKQL
ncbi:MULTISPECIES: AzlC family ABC transporter permease [Acinetobacter]|uniref:AzlC family ABC transporter permease n=1 Tax=Acinetobacter TaxID=469 RepID=UPI0006FCEA2E|nr:MULTISPECIES: AzlC family ABC transporter permease [Acinetobacter]KQW98350.1 branched-chain amino acid ABC transporter permease [Acinetobacter sp. Root1280]